MCACMCEYAYVCGVWCVCVCACVCEHMCVRVCMCTRVCCLCMQLAEVGPNTDGSNVHVISEVRRTSEVVA